MKQRDYFLQQITAGEQISKTIQSGYNYGVSAAIALKPENVSKTVKYAAAKFHTLTWAQIFIEFLKLVFRLGKGIVMFLLFIVMTFFRFIFYLTSPEDSKEDRESVQQLAAHADQHQPIHPVNNMPFFRSTRHGVDAFGMSIRTEEANGVPPSVPPPTFVEEPVPNGAPAHSNQADYSSQEIPEDPRPPNGNVQSDEFAEDENLLKPPQMAGQQRRSPSVYDTQSFASQPMQLSVPSIQEDERARLSYYEPKIAEQLATRSKGSVLNVLARNFKTIEKITLYLAFFINVILLFHRVDIAINGDNNRSRETEEEEDEDTVDEVMESIYISGMIVPYFTYEITGWMLAQVSFKVVIKRVIFV